jgi:DNA-binding NtrC family response regulator
MTSRKDGLAEHSILIVAGQPAAGILLQQCARRGWKGVAAGLCSEAEATLQAQVPGIVLTQDALPDGTWREVFESAAAIRPEAVRAVCSSRSTLQLWMDVLARGGCELLPEPCPDELLERVFHRYGQMKSHTCDSV